MFGLVSKRKYDLLLNRVAFLEHEIEKLCTKDFNEDFKLGDKIWFFYSGRHGRNYHGYYDGVIEEIRASSNGYIEYTIDTTGCKQRFSVDFRTTKDHISHSLKLLREKIVRSDYVFVIDESVCEPEMTEGAKQ